MHNCTNPVMCENLYAILVFTSSSYGRQKGTVFESECTMRLTECNNPLEIKLNNGSRDVAGFPIFCEVCREAVLAD